MIETTTRSRKDPLKPIKMEDIKIEFVDLCMLPSDGMNILEFDSGSSDQGSPMPMEVTISSDSSSSSETVRPRKRAKLDHLSPEEKAQHRKMMNRISAQSARDRQKALMCQQETTIKSFQTNADTWRKQNVTLTSANAALSAENKTLKAENERLSALVLEMEEKLKAASQNQINMTQTSTVQDVKPEVKDEDNRNCCGSSMEPAVLRAVPLQKGPSEPLQNLSHILLLWTLYLGIWTHLKSCKSSENSQKKFSVENNSCQNLNSLAQLQKLLLHKWLLRPRQPGLEERTPG